MLHLASSTLKIVLSHFIDGPGARPGRRVFAMPREEEGVAIAAGLELAGARPVLIFQDNGIGNLLTALLTLGQPYHLPLLAVVSRRGGLGEYNSMIHTISERAEALLDAAGVRWFQLDARTPVEPLDGRDRARMGVRARDAPARVRAGQPDGLVTMADLDRADVLRFIDAAAPDSPMVLSLGGIAREMLAVAGRKGNHFISLDAMGQTVPVALGLALGLERRAGVGQGHRDRGRWLAADGTCPY